MELALCLPLLVVVTSAVIEVGGVATDQVRLWHAAREAARVAVVDPDVDAAHRVVRTAGLDGAAVDVVPEPYHRRPGQPLTVRISYRPTARVPLLRPILRRLELRATATMRIEQP